MGDRSTLQKSHRQRRQRYDIADTWLDRLDEMQTLEVKATIGECADIMMMQT